MFGEKWDVFEMQHDGCVHGQRVRVVCRVARVLWPGPLRTDLNDIQTKRGRFNAKLRKIGADRTTQDAPLALIYGIVTGHKGPVGSSLHFDENQGVAVPAHEIDFLTTIARTAPITHQDDKAPLARQPSGSEMLAALSGIG